MNINSAVWAGHDDAPVKRQSRYLGSLLSIVLPCVILAFISALFAHNLWAAVLGPLGIALLVSARLNKNRNIHAANWVLILALTAAATAIEYGQFCKGPAPLFVSIITVFLSGFLLGRRLPSVIAALNALPQAIHLHFIVAAHILLASPVYGLSLKLLPFLPIVLLSVIALASSLLASSLENARTRADELAWANSALADANARLEALATADPLTGLLNHRGLVAALDAELERADRHGRTCALVFLDIDHFKSLNDSYGHAAGDIILREFAQVVRASLRGVDVFGRWGGEEFIILLPEIDTASAAAAAERIRASVAEHVFPTAGGLRLTCSIGMADCPADAKERSGLLEAADHAMYAAKRLGRNQVRCASDPAVGVLWQESAPNGSREETAILGTVEALASLVAARDCYTGEHSQEVGSLAVLLSEALGMTSAEARMVGLAGRLHDIGKVAVPDAILHKPGQLSEDDWAVIRRHPKLGAEVIGHAPTLRELAPLIRGHHERWDGGGYPDGLAGVRIPLGARILAVADTYLAMTSERPYRGAINHLGALEQIHHLAGSQFDPRVVEALLTVFHTREIGKAA